MPVPTLTPLLLHRGRGSALAAAEGRRPGINRSAPRIVGSSKKERRAMLTQKSELAKEFENSDSGSVAIVLGAAWVCGAQ